jgi:hypothetical protein
MKLPTLLKERVVDAKILKNNEIAVKEFRTLELRNHHVEFCSKM